MEKLNLTSQEKEKLLMVLERYLPDIKSEIAHTDSKEFREALKDREVFMADLIGRLRH